MTEEKVAVQLPANIGVKFCGPYKAGEIYHIDAVEAERLINVKRFKRVDMYAPDDEKQEN